VLGKSRRWGESELAWATSHEAAAERENEREGTMNTIVRKILPREACKGNLTREACPRKSRESLGGKERVITPSIAEIINRGD